MSDMPPLSSLKRAPAVSEAALVEMRCEIIDELHDEVEELRWQRMVLLATLTPFAKAAEQFAWPCFAPSGQSITPGTDLYVRHLRSARDVCEQADGPKQAPAPEAK